MAPPPIATRALAAAEERVEAPRAREPEVAHEYHERFGQIEVHRGEAGASGCSLPAQSRNAVAIVGGAFVGIAQHLVRFGHELEFFFGGLVAVIAIGMALHRELAVGLLDVCFARVPLDAEDDVEILLHLLEQLPHES